MSAEHHHHRHFYTVPAPGYPAHGVQYHAGYPLLHPGQTMMGPIPQPPAGYHPFQAYQTMPAPAHPMQQNTSFLGFSNDSFIKGLLIGAAATYIITNETVQRTAIKGAVKVWSMMQGGAEELKERFLDAEAEIRAAEASKNQ